MSPHERKVRQSQPDDTEFLSHLSDIASEDTKGLIEAQKHYGNSWKVRGGVGAFMMLARKWDRLEKRVSRHPSAGGDSSVGVEPERGDRYDILQHLIADDRAEGIIDDIRDLRRYLMLVEAEARAMGCTSAFSKHRDSPRPEHT